MQLGWEWNLWRASDQAVSLQPLLETLLRDPMQCRYDVCIGGVVLDVMAGGSCGGNPGECAAATPVDPGTAYALQIHITSSHHITSHHIILHHTQRITSHHITSCTTLSRHTALPDIAAGTDAAVHANPIPNHTPSTTTQHRTRRARG